MQLYNVENKEATEVRVISAPTGIVYPEKLSKEELLALGYAPIEYGEYPKELGELEKVVTHIDTTSGYSVDYKVEPMASVELVEAFKEKIQEVLDTAAREKGYDNIVSACSYAGYDNPFKAEGEAFGKWRAEVWAKGYELLGEIENGSRKLPESFREILDLLPIFDKE